MSYLGDTLTVSLILVLLFGSVALYLYTRIQQTEQKVSLLESIVLDLKLTGEIQPFTNSHSPVSPPSPPFTDSHSPVSPPSPPFTDSSASASDSSVTSASSAPVTSAPSAPVTSAPSAPVTSAPVTSASSSSSAIASIFLPSYTEPFTPSYLSEDESIPVVKEEYQPFKDEAEAEVDFGSESLGDREIQSNIQELLFIPTSSYDSMSLKELQGMVRSRGIPMEKGAKKYVLVELLKRHDTESNEVKPGSLSSSSILESSLHNDD